MEPVKPNPPRLDGRLVGFLLGWRQRLAESVLAGLRSGERPIDGGVTLRDRLRLVPVVDDGVELLLRGL